MPAPVGGHDGRAVGPAGEVLTVGDAGCPADRPIEVMYHSADGLCSYSACFRADEVEPEAIGEEA